MLASLLLLVSALSPTKHLLAKICAHTGSDQVTNDPANRLIIALMDSGPHKMQPFSPIMDVLLRLSSPKGRFRHLLSFLFLL